MDENSPSDADKRRIARRNRARSNWTPTGPHPRGAGRDPALIPQFGETLDCFAGHWMIFQLKNGHRYSTDDLLAAAFALGVVEEMGLDVDHVLDMGSGIGSVGLFLLWAMPGLYLTGVERQGQSLVMAERSARFNGVEHRCRFVHRDLKNGLDDLGQFPLITASPPYWASRDGTLSDAPQKGPCRFELTGTLEDYCAASVSALEENGIFCIIFDGRQKPRLRRAFEEAGLALVCIQDVISKVGRPPLMVLAAGMRSSSGPIVEREPLELRHENGYRTEAFRRLRLRMGLPPGKVGPSA